MKMYSKVVTAVIIATIMGMMGDADGRFRTFPEQQQQRDAIDNNVVIMPPGPSSSLYSSLVSPSSKVQRQGQEMSTTEPTTSTAVMMDPSVDVEDAVDADDADAVDAYTVGSDVVVKESSVSNSNGTDTDSIVWDDSASQGPVIGDMVDVVVPVKDNYDYASYQGLLNSQWPAMTESCARNKRKFDPLTQKRVYKVGVQATAGVERAWQDYNTTFLTYLNAVVGPRFDPPIQFEMEVSTNPLNNWVDDEVGRDTIDFLYTDTGTYSCMGVELGTQGIATTIASRYVRGRKYDLDVFGGTMFTTQEHDDINTVADLKDKIIGAQVISNFGSAQIQFYVMQENGLDYIMDPKQVVFFINNDDVVKAVLDGTVDVGFVRSGHVERTIDPSTGQLVDPEKIKTLDPRIHIMDNGELFPFLHSTPAFPEWPVYARPDMDPVVAIEVQNALINLGDHKKVGDAIYDCLTSNLTSIEQKEVCRQAPPAYFYDEARCDTTREIAEIARQAGLTGSHNGFRNIKSYYYARTVHQAAGFAKQDERGTWKCIRANTLYEGISCPEGTYKVKHEIFVKQCADQGLHCPEGTECFCRPCIQAFEVDVMQIGFDSWNQTAYGSASEDTGVDAAVDVSLSVDLIAASLDQDEDILGCDKMSLCGKFHQRDTAMFVLYDNRERVGSDVRVVMHAGQETLDLPVTPHPNISFLYEFEYTTNTRGISIMEVFFDGVQIPESPFRIETTRADCGDNLKTADADGLCICAAGTVEIGATCFDAGIFAAIVVSVAAVIIVVCTFFYLQHRRAKSDEVWQVKVDELHFGQKAEVIGQGSFGVVLLAEYRGTKVAIKRVLPVGGGTGSRHGSMSKAHKTSSTMAKGSGTGSKESLERGTGSFTGSLIKAQRRRASQESGETGSSDEKSCSDDEDRDIETGMGGTRSSVDPDVVGSICSDDDDFGFLGHLSYGRQKTKWERLLPNWMYNGSGVDQYNASILGTASASTYSRTVSQRICPWFTEDYHRKQEFIQEMRLLSRLRHPCITTVMGATVQHGRQEPMMVMEYMENGSLYDLLQNETLHISGDLIVQIFRDVSQGMRFLHASKPPILHGDLKAKNILVDSRFRAKVADFGLSKKTVGNLSGTPYWLAPEYLRGKTDYNASCDVYSFGITMWETYSRSAPYADENPRKVLRLVCDPRISKRPTLQGVGAPPKIIEIMTKCWSHDVGFRPTSKDLDMMFTDMSPIDAEPILINDEITAKLKRTQKAEGDMLYRVFPRKVADKLKAGQRVEAETHEMVTIFFSDIVHFTDISRELPAEKVCDMLGRLYEAFDALATKHEVFKVETIGDAWMGVTNLENTQSDSHAKRIAEFAVEAVEAASLIPIDSDDETKGYVKIRVGFHSGSVVSNVIGSLNPRYGLFGDTVNTASRMESNSRPGRIHCSEDAAVLLQDQAPNMPLQQRGKIQVKGKGSMLTYWVGKGMTGLKNSTSSVAGDDRTTMASNKNAGHGDDDGNNSVEKPPSQHVSFPELSPHSSMGESGAGDRGFNAKKAIGHLDVTHVDMTGDVGASGGAAGVASVPDLLDTEDITENACDFLDDVEDVARPVAPIPRSDGDKTNSRRSRSVDPPDSLMQTKLAVAEARAEFKRSSSSAGAA